jgi:hypothetical protein
MCEYAVINAHAQTHRLPYLYVVCHSMLSIHWVVNAPPMHIPSPAREDEDVNDGRCHGQTGAVATEAFTPTAVRNSSVHNA